MKKFQTCSSTKTYKTSINAAKQYAGLTIEDVNFETVLLTEQNCDNKAHHGRYIPVARGVNALNYNIHFYMHVIE